MLILASQSPRRKELLKMTGIPFQCVASHADESIPHDMAAEDVPEYLAGKKAEAVCRTYPQDVILGVDTLVVFEGRILGKPRTPEEAFAILSQLSGQVHHVYTGVAILGPESRIHFTTVTKVEFYELTEEEIRRYIATGEPMDKAGAYGIQGKGALFIKRIHGDYYSVVGLPLAEVVRHLPDSVKREAFES